MTATTWYWIAAAAMAPGSVVFGFTSAWVQDGARKAASGLWALASAATLLGLLFAYESFEGWAFVPAAGIQ
ncbi:hypothetical protein, partial [Rubrivirga sp.]|uniref:hypothetical protein n=1 Tax=Rubrivirga sp. TaxID=1885344 RepID=UPI003C77BE1B